MGIVGLVVLLVSWTTLLVAPNFTSPQWVPDVWIAVLIALPFAIVLAVMAGRRSSKWWYLVAGLGLLSLAFMLGSVAV
jgi:hypothetical protein